MFALSFVALVGALDGGVERVPLDRGVAVIYDTCPAAPPTVALDGGWKLLPPERAARLACIMETCEVDRKLARAELKAAAPPLWWLAVVGAAVSAFLLGWFLPRP